MERGFGIHFELRTASLKAELANRLAAGEGLRETAIKGVYIGRWEHPRKRELLFGKPFIGILISGDNVFITRSSCFYYGNYVGLMDKKEMSAPLFAVFVLSDAALLESFEKTIGTKASDSRYPYEKIELLDAFLRLVRLADMSAHIDVLAPMIIREIHYFSLFEPEKTILNIIDGCMEGTNRASIRTAIEWLRENYLAPLDLRSLACRANMSVPSLHRHFRKVTGLSPLQFQKFLRLHEARRLLIRERADVAAAACEVGYSSETQFSREYKRFFGETPRRDINRLLNEGISAGDIFTEIYQF